MKHFCFLIFLCAGTVALAQPSSKAAVETLNRGIIESKANDAALFHAIKESFDLNSIAVLSIGKRRWKSWDKKERAEYIYVFTNYLIALYQDRFGAYEGGGLDIYKVEEKGNRALVYSRIEVMVDENTLADDKPVKIHFSVYKRKNEWLINDVYFKGTISEVAGFRAKFANTLKEKGREGLVSDMKKKCKDFGKYCKL